MFCKNCGAALSAGTRFCTGCGAGATEPPSSRPAAQGGSIGYSQRIHDPAFAGYIKNTNRWSAVFSVILAVVAVVGFTIYGEVSREMENPQAMLIGLGIGALFLLIALSTIVARKNSKTWDGVVVDKTIQQKSHRRHTGDDDYYLEHYTEYTVLVQDGRGKIHRLTAEDDDTRYQYFQVGDHVRHHAGLNSYEKYDKSRDSIIFCNACATLCKITEDTCPRCHCPLLK